LLSYYYNLLAIIPCRAVWLISQSNLEYKSEDKTCVAVSLGCAFVLISPSLCPDEVSVFDGRPSLIESLELEDFFSHVISNGVPAWKISHTQKFAMKGEPRGAKWKSVYFETVCYL
jgi:hypothetical protein